VRPGARSISYYLNALGDPRWPPKTAGCAQSSTEGVSTIRFNTRFNTTETTQQKGWPLRALEVRADAPVLACRVAQF
jgi:hypothetical protein